MNTIYQKLKNLGAWGQIHEHDAELDKVVVELEKLDRYSSDANIMEKVDQVFTDPKRSSIEVARELAAIRVGLEKPAEQKAAPPAPATETVVETVWFKKYIAAHPSQERPLKALASRIDTFLKGPLAQHRSVVHSRLQTVVESGDKEAVLATFKRFHDDLEKAVGPARPTPRPTPAGQTPTARPGAPVPAKEGVLGTLTKKVGPLPVWVYGSLVMVLSILAVVLLWSRGPEIPPEEVTFGLVTPSPGVLPELTQPAIAPPIVEATAEPTLTPTPDIRTKYEVWKAQANDASVGQMGYAGPDDAYAVVAPALTPGILYDVVKYQPNQDWVIVLPQAGGQPAFYPRSAFENLIGDPQTGQPQILPLESIDRLYQGLRTKEVAGRQTSPIVILLVGILGLLAFPFILVEAIGRDELGDAIHTMIVIGIMIITAVILPTIAFIRIAIGVYDIGSPNEVPVDPLVLQNLLDVYAADVAKWVTVVILLWTVWVAISPIRSLVYVEDEDDYLPKWFPRFDLTPLANVFLLSGLLSVLGVRTIAAIAWGVKAGEHTTTLQGVFTGFTASATPALTSFAMTCLVTAVIIYAVENIRSGQFLASLGAIALSGIYFLIRYYAPTWHPIFPLVIAVVFTAGVFAVMYTIGNTRRLITALKWGDVMLTVVDVAALFMLSFGIV